MATGKTDILVFADWDSKSTPQLVGTLSAHHAKGKKVFSFDFNSTWLTKEKPFFFDPNLSWNTGKQFPANKTIFGVLSESMPDTWGRTLMKRRESILASAEKRPVRTLGDLDFLLGVQDAGRMGALRFKLEMDGPFLSQDDLYPTPPWSSIRELQHGISLVESNKNTKEVQKWLKLLVAPGSSLGGARPKANIIDEKNNLWIAKFPSKLDTINKAAWEYLAFKLARKAGIEMADCKVEKVSGKFHTFFTNRFDRIKQQRVHFVSAMTMTGNNEELLKNTTASYLDLAEFIRFNENNNTADLHQLWRRMVFNIAISNTDDHLRNHGFILKNGTWKLSPAFDINPSIDKDGLALNIDMENNSLDFDLAKSVAHYFDLNESEAKRILNDVLKATKTWKAEAKKIGIARSEQELMAAAFRFE